MPAGGKKEPTGAVGLNVMGGGTMVPAVGGLTVPGGGEGLTPGGGNR